MPKDLFSLFDDHLRTDHDLVAGDPQTLETISEQDEERDRILGRISALDQVEPKIDYSDFSKFVFFNSAYDYFNLTAEKILNEYPYDGTVAQIENFRNALDGYQRYVLTQWPRSTGHLRFNPTNGSSWINVVDAGIQDGVARSSFLSPGTGSFSIEFWMNAPLLTGSNDVMVLFQKVTGSGDGCTIYLSGSTLNFRVVSGSLTSEVSSQFSPGSNSYLACVLDRDSFVPLVSILTGSTNSFPVVSVSASTSITGPMFLGPTAVTIGSGSLSGKIVRPYTGSLDQVAVWSTPRALADVTSSFNTKLYSQKELVALWRFNESGSVPNDTGTNSVVIDYSGHKLNGQIRNYFSGIRGSGSLVPYDSPDLFTGLYFNSPEIQGFINVQQTSGSAYDRDNDSLITELVPDKFFELEENTTVLRDFLYVIARQFDYLKQRIDQFINVTKANYGDFDQVPDALLADVARFFGWEFTGNFLTAEASEYLIGKGVLGHVESNREIDTKLYEIKNEFWKRTLVNLTHLYKTKGTRESTEALLRIYGVNKNFVRLKEYGFNPTSKITTARVHAEKSVYALGFGSGSAQYPLPTASLGAGLGLTTAESVEVRVRFPTTLTQNITSSINSGSIWCLTSGSTQLYQLYYTKSAPSSLTGSLTATGSFGSVSLTNVGIFDGDWYNVSLVRNPLSGTTTLDVRSIDRDVTSYHSSSMISGSVVTSSLQMNFKLGATGSYLCQHWAQEFRVWNRALTQLELSDHSLNFQSYGAENVSDASSQVVHLRLNEGYTASSSGTLANIFDLTGQAIVSGSGFVPSNVPYEKYLLDYNYIAPVDFGWTDDKIRIYDAPRVPLGEGYRENSVVALEFNMVDALNEDVSQILATIDGFNNSVGLPTNRYRSDYPDLSSLRRTYFSRLQGSLNFRVFVDMLEFFDKSFIDLVRRLLPVRSTFIGAEIVVENHMLERPKIQWNYRRQNRPFQPEGRIKIFIR